MEYGIVRVSATARKPEMIAIARMAPGIVAQTERAASTAVTMFLADIPVIKKRENVTAMAFRVMILIFPIQFVQKMVVNQLMSP